MSLEALPNPSQRNIAIHVKPSAERHLKQGHPWLFEGSIESISHQGQSGDIAIIFDRKRRFLAVGLYDPHSPIRVKILQHGTSAKIDADFFFSRIQTASQLRQPLLDGDTNGYRVVHGENDGLSGLVIDRYADTLVIKLYSKAWFPHLKHILNSLDALFPECNWVLRMSRGVQDSDPFGFTDGQVLRGNVPETPLLFRENGLTFSSDVRYGHKTGFFFDQRENRQRAAHFANGAKVLDVFSYNGGFSVYSASGGATHVTSVDISEPALTSARENMALNRHHPLVAKSQHDTIVGDAFAVMERLRDAGKRFDLVIVDPPSFAKSQDEVSGALNAYRRLTELAVRLTTRGGIVMMASCSSRVTADDFFKTIALSAQRVGYPLHQIERSQHALDHPLRESFPEGAYLKCLIASVPG